MHVINVHEVKQNFLKLVAAAMQGEQVIIEKGGKPVVQLIAYKPKRQFCLLKKKIKIPEDFDDPLPDDLIAEFEK